MNYSKNTLFIGGIDTDIGKTYATGVLAKALYSKEIEVITQKLVQTGCEGIAEDIITHRDIMGMPLQALDKDGTTCPYVFSKPASPHLSSTIENIQIDPELITANTHKLAAEYEIVLLEGAGGLMVPITESLLTLDYIAERGYPVVLVTSGRLGSINHTLLSIEAIKSRSLQLHAVIYNHWQPDKHLYSNYEPDQDIVDSTKDYLQTYLKHNYPDTFWVDLPYISPDNRTIKDTTNNPYPALGDYVQAVINEL